MPVLTISGQTGSGAHNVGQLTAERLEIDYVDQEILVEAARELGVPMQAVVSHDERTPGLGERLASMLRRFLERSAAAGASDPMLGSGGLDVVLGRTYAEAAAEDAQDITDEQYLEALTGIVVDLYAQGDMVIIGRGSQQILRDQPGIMQALLVAPLEARIEMFAQRQGLGLDEAEKRVRDFDKGRAKFHQKFFKVDVDDPALYHITVNTARLSQEQAADAIAEAARGLTRA